MANENNKCKYHSRDISNATYAAGTAAFLALLNLTCCNPSGKVHTLENKVNNNHTALTQQINSATLRLEKEFLSQSPQFKTQNIFGEETPETFYEFSDGTRAYITIDGVPVEDFVRDSYKTQEK